MIVFAFGHLKRILHLIIAKLVKIGYFAPLPVCLTLIRSCLLVLCMLLLSLEIHRIDFLPLAFGLGNHGCAFTTLENVIALSRRARLDTVSLLR